MADDVKTNTAEGGTDGVTVTTGNSGGASGDALANVQGAWTFEADAAKVGGLGYQIILDATSRYLRGDDLTVSAGERGGMGMWFYWPGGTITATFSVGAMRTAADAQLGSVNVFSTDTKLYFYNRAGTRVAGSASSEALAAGWYRYEFIYTPGGTTATAQVTVKAWKADGTQIMNYDSGAAYDAGVTDPAGRFRFGTGTNAGGLTTFWMDNLRWGHKATGDLGDVANIPPTATITGNQDVAAGATVNVSVSASDTDGTIATYAWTVVAASSTSTPTLTGASTSAISFTAPAAGNLVTLQCVVTDNGGATVTKTTEVRVPSSSGTVRHLAFDGTGVGTWTKNGGSSTHGAALSDESDATYIESPTIGGTENTLRSRLIPMTARSGLTVTEKLALDVAGTPTVKVRLYEGSTLRQEWTQVVTTTATSYDYGLSSPGSISDWGNLYIEYSVVN